MPSKKKKAKGKRRVAKTKNEGDEVKNDVQMQRLKIISSDKKKKNSDQENEDKLLEEAINLAASEREKLEAAARNADEINIISERQCRHGFVPLPRGHICARFIKTFVRELNFGNGNDIIEVFFAHKARKEWVEVWTNPDMLQVVISYFLLEGTNFILDKRDDLACHAAILVRMFEQWRAVATCNPEVLRKCSKKWNDTCDQHTLVSMFRNRIPCKCLDKRYKEVKSIVKMGHCNNEGCPLPDKKAERSKLMNCEQCRVAQYCSIECQKAAWPSHKEFCVTIRDSMKGGNSNSD